MKKLSEISASGGWEAETEFRSRAQLAVQGAREWNAQLDVIWADPKTHAGPLSDKRRVHIRKTLNTFRLYADATVLNCALAAESVMNFYGVVRLGEKFYNEHYERLRPSQKLSALAATCRGLLFEKSDSFIVRTNRLFALRNDLAHPKAREISDELKYKSRLDRLAHAEECIGLLDHFLRDFVAMDPEAAWIASNA